MLYITIGPSLDRFKKIKCPNVINKVTTAILFPQFGRAADFITKKTIANGIIKYKIISFYAKKARGLMARWIIQNQIKDFEKLSEFNLDGYYYSEEVSSATEPVFLRD